MLKFKIPVIGFFIILMSNCQPVLEGLDLLFPDKNFQTGWEWDGRPVHYDPENLYELINGEAELYHAYGFQELAVLSYYHKSPEDSFFTVHIYDMGTPENAFGVYSSYRYPGYTFDTIGVEAMLSDFGMKFYKGQYFVDISYGDMVSSIQQAGLACARQIADNITGPDDPPAVVNLLPGQNQIDKSLRYAASEMLNQSFLPAGVEAKYNLNGEEIVGFVILFDDAEKAKSGFDELKQFYINTELEPTKISKSEDPSFAVKTKYQGSIIVVQKDRFIAGARELENAKQGYMFVQSILSGLE